MVTFQVKLTDVVGSNRWPGTPQPWLIIWLKQTVTEVQEESPAARAGLKKLQTIRQVEKTPVQTPSQFARAVGELKGPVTLLTDQGSITVGE